MVGEDKKQSREDPNLVTLDSKLHENGGIMDGLFSPGFKSLAAMAGWDEEALLLASLVVDDTPVREFKSKKRFVLHCKSTPTSSRRKRRARSGIPDSIPATVLDLGEDENPVKGSEEKNVEAALEQQSCASSSSSPRVPCMDKLREELSCAICLELCFEPSTTSCGHSFCKKCLRSAADKCGKRCPKCRQLISNGRSCTVNTVLWNTIQLLFPQETEARKTAGAATITGDKAAKKSPERAFYDNLQNRNTRESLQSSQGGRSRRRRRPAQEEEGESEQRLERAAMAPQARSSETNLRSQRRGGRGWTPTPNQDEDAALALRLQREEFMGTFREPPPQEQVATTSLSLARANLRAMATRAINVRSRTRHL